MGTNHRDPGLERPAQALDVIEFRRDRAERAFAAHMDQQGQPRRRCHAVELVNMGIRGIDRLRGRQPFDQDGAVLDAVGQQLEGVLAVRIDRRPRQ